jgi:HAE1 family hydrophobic/amphiphilic exporter-1
VKIVDLSIRRPVTVFIFSVAAVVFGIVAFRNLAVNLLPDISYPSLTVRTTYEGTAPVEIESLLTRPIENAVGVVNNVVRVTSSSRADMSEVTLEFAWDTNMDFAALDVRDRLDRVRLPLDAELPVLLKYDPSLDPIMRIALFGSDELARLRFLGEEDIKRALERIEGVAAVVVSGGLEEEIQVELDERKLASLGLSVGQIANRLAAENVNITGGTGCRKRQHYRRHPARRSHRIPRAHLERVHASRGHAVDRDRAFRRRDRSAVRRGQGLHGPQGARDHHPHRRCGVG